MIFPWIGEISKGYKWGTRPRSVSPRSHRPAPVNESWACRGTGRNRRCRRQLHPSGYQM